jgi:TolB-like protein
MPEIKTPPRAPRDILARAGQQQVFSLRRKLIAILVADIAGYSRMMGRDEAGTAEEMRRRLKQSIRPLIAANDGRLVKTLGDGFLAEFDSAVNAVECAVKLQKEMIARNYEVPAERRLHFRIGVNLGDVIREGRDIIGDGVNVAARIQSIAEPDGILVSLPVQQQVAGKTPYSFADKGEHALKNIALPVRVFSVVLAAPKPAAAPQPIAARDNPVIAVLPFTAMSAEQDQQYFGDGIAEDLITDLSRFRTLSVIARNSSFVYRDKATDIKTIAEALGVQFVVEGSVRKLGGRVRITAQLINADTRRHVWADRYDVDVADIFSVQDDVTRRVAATIVPRIEVEGLEIARRRPTDHPRAYDFYLRGKAAFYAAHDGAAIAEARKDFEQAVTLDPEFAAAYCYLARIDNNLTMFSGAGTSLKPLRERAWEFARKAAALDDSDPHTQITLAWCHLWRHEFEAARKHLDLAAQLNPNDADRAVDRGTTLMYLGEADAAIDIMTAGIRLNPLHPDAYLGDLAEAYFVAHRYGDMIEVAQKIPDPSPRFAAWKAAGYAYAGDTARAKAEAERFVHNVKAIWAGDPAAGPPQYVDWLLSFSPFRRAEDLEHFRTGLSLAGLNLD